MNAARLRAAVAPMLAALLACSCADERVDAEVDPDASASVADEQPPLPPSTLTPLQDVRLVTAAERSGYTQTMTSAEVERFCDTLADQSERVTRLSMGRSHEGRDIPLLIVADPPIETAKEARADGRMTVLILNNIHAGEVCGKEASLMIARSLGLARERPPVFDDLIIAIVPNYNPDGNDDMGPDNRPGQHGPEEMGSRHNAQEFDLNRDYIKAEAPETRALLRFKNEWDPAITVDTHTTNGSNHRYVLTYQGPKHPGGDETVLRYVRDRMLPAIDARFENGTEWKTEFYGNFDRDHTRWMTYPAEPRFGTPYRGLRNRISVLSEAYSYAPYKDRVLATLRYCELILGYAAERREEIQTLLAAADARAVEREGPMALRHEARPFPYPITVLGYEAIPVEGRRHPDKGAPRDYEVEFVNDFVPTLSVDLPQGYYLSPDLQHIADHLRLHGVEVVEMDARATERLRMPIEVYRIISFEQREREWQGHRMLYDVEVEIDRALGDLEPGGFLVWAGQPLFPLAAFMLEPQSSDGLVAWNFLDDFLAPGRQYPIARIVE